MADKGKKRKKIRVSPDSPYASSEELRRGFDQRLPSAVSSTMMRERSPFGNMSPRAALQDVIAGGMDLFRGEEGRRGSRYAEKVAEELVKRDSGYKKGGKVKAKKASKPKVRGAGKVMKGVRAAKMVAMKGA